MDLRQPMRVVTPTLDGDVLAILARADKAFSNGEIASAIPDASKEGVRKALRRLVEQGIVERTRAGNALMYRLNRDHLAAPAIEALANIRLRLIERLRETIAEWRMANGEWRMANGLSRPWQPRCSAQLDVATE